MAFRSQARWLAMDAAVKEPTRRDLGLEVRITDQQREPDKTQAHEKNKCYLMGKSTLQLVTEILVSGTVTGEHTLIICTRCTEILFSDTVTDKQMILCTRCTMCTEIVTLGTVTGKHNDTVYNVY